MPEAVLASFSMGLTITRSSRGLRAIDSYSIKVVELVLRVGCGVPGVGSRGKSGPVGYCLLPIPYCLLHRLVLLVRVLLHLLLDHLAGLIDRDIPSLALDHHIGRVHGFAV